MSYEAEYVEGVLRTESKLTDINGVDITYDQFAYTLGAGISFDYIKRQGYYTVKPDEARLTKQLVEASQIVDNLKSSGIRKYGETGISPRTLHGIFGLITESIEILESLAIAIAHKTQIDATNMKEELGDIEYYLALLRTDFGVTQEQIQRGNLAKLEKRYPKATPDELGAERNKDVELGAMTTTIDGVKTTYTIATGTSINLVLDESKEVDVAIASGNHDPLPDTI